MKIVTSVLAALLVLALGAAAAFYFMTYTPMATDYARMKAGLPAFDAAKAELRQCQAKAKAQEKKTAEEQAWKGPALVTLQLGLADAIKEGKAEVLDAGDRLIVNIPENAVYLHHSYVFQRHSPKLLDQIASSLKDDRLKGLEVTIGNTTDAVPARGRGRRRIPAKSARELAADRSGKLVQYLERDGLNGNVMIAAAYSAHPPKIGTAFLDHKVIITIEKMPQLQPVATQQNAKPKMIPIVPAKPKTP